MKKKKQREKEIPEYKIRNVENIARLTKSNNTLLIASIKNLPDRQFQAIKKKLRGKADIKVVKKTIAIRAFDMLQKAKILDFKKFLGEDQALIFSKNDAFELSAMLSKNKSMSKAKAGQIAPEEIAIEPGATELVPGPVISELSSLGIKFAIEDGKINIKERKVILKAGQEISEQASGIMSKLDMKIIPVGLEPIVAYDYKEDKIYENVKFSPEKVLEEVKSESARALAFAVKIAYMSKDTIKYLLGKALSHEKALEKFISNINTQENIQQNNIQEGK